MRDLSIQLPETGSRRKLLLVEDDASVLASLEMFLKAEYEIYSATTVRAGVSLFKSLQPSLTVLDLRLPDGDGLDALREIRCLSATAPVIVLTGYASLKSVEESLRLGASDYLHKPFDGFALKSRIDQLAVHPAFRDTHEEDSGQHPAQFPPRAAQRIAELELQARASAMFLHDAAGPVMTALTSAHFLCQAIEETPERFDKDTRQMGDLLYEAMGFISGLFEQSRSIECLSRLEASEVALHKVVNLAVNLVRSKAQDRKVHLTVHLQKGDSRIVVNQFALARVLLNLMRNAVEAVEPGGGRVALFVDAMPGHVEFTIQDNGPGIAPHFMERVFEACFTTKKDGTGLGLYICKHLVESMSGTIAVRNEPGQGCHFTIKIPRSI